MSALVVQLRPVAGRWLRARSVRVGSLAWRLSLRRSVRTLVGLPLVVLGLAGVGVPRWAIGFMVVEGLVVGGFWLLCFWVLRKLREAPLPGPVRPVARPAAAARRRGKRS